MQYFLSLGSNMGDEIMIQESAITTISKKIGKINSRSSFYATAPWGRKDIHPFINCCIGVESNKPPETAILIILEIERDLGRERKEKWGNRTIDIDILFCDAMTIQIPGLSLPHPLLQERLFVLSPLLEIAPHFIHPVLNKTIEELYIHNILKE